MAAEGRRNTPRRASLSAALFLGRNECPGTHCSLIVKEKTTPARYVREFEEKEWTEKNKVCREQSESLREEKWQNCWCWRYQRRAHKMAQVSAEKLEQTRPVKKEREAIK